MAIAPVGFGTFGGDLIVSGFGGIVAFNPNTFASTTFLSASNIYSGVAFTNDGRLLVADYNNNRILAVTAGGISSVFATVSSPGAIAVNPNTGDVYVAAENTGTIEHFLSNGTYVDALASNVIWDYGYYPSDLAFTADGTGLIYGQVGISDPSAGIREITGFQGPNVSTPEPSTLISATLAGLFAIGYACYRRTAQIA